jgi:hypothetical protein
MIVENNVVDWNISDEKWRVIDLKKMIIKKNYFLLGNIL